MLIGYTRISTQDQDPALQKDALEKIGCEKIFEDCMTGTRSDRPGLQAALSHLRKGDVFVVWKLDRVGRSLKHIVQFAHDLEERGVQFRSLTENIDTTTPMGRFFFHMMGALAQMERDLMIERTRAGLEAARARGRQGGRPRKLDDEKLQFARELIESGKQIQEVARVLGVNRSTLYRRIQGSDKQPS